MRELRLVQKTDGTVVAKTPIRSEEPIEQAKLRVAATLVKRWKLVWVEEEDGN
jgi:hypothetical protein